MRRFVLLWSDGVKRYVGRACRVASREAQDCGRKMCTWSRQRRVRLCRSVMVLEGRVESGVGSKEVRRWRIEDARRGTLKW